MNFVRAWIAIVALAASLVGQSPSVVVEGIPTASDRFPIAGQQTVVSLSDGEPTGVSVTYRPSSLVSRVVELEPSDDGVWSWTPDAAGLAELQVTYDRDGAEHTATRTVSVGFASVVDSGVLVMVFAGLVLFGGAFVSIRALLRDD